MPQSTHNPKPQPPELSKASAVRPASPHPPDTQQRPSTVQALPTSVILCASSEATTSSSTVRPDSRVCAELDELQSKAELGVISESALVEELQVLHGEHGTIFRMEDFQEESARPSHSLELQDIAAAQSSHIAFGEFHEDYDFDTESYQAVIVLTVS